MTKFKKRYGISLAKTYGEAASVDVEILEEAQAKIAQWCATYPSDKIFNMDETGLFHNLSPTRSLVTAVERNSNLCGNKKDKARVTVALTCNMSGTLRCKLLVIGTAKRPRAFRQFNHERYVVYDNNASAWMDEDRFQRYLQWFDNYLDRLGMSEVLLVVDCAPSHKVRGY